MGFGLQAAKAASVRRGLCAVCMLAVGSLLAPAVSGKAQAQTLERMRGGQESHGGWRGHGSHGGWHGGSRIPGIAIPAILGVIGAIERSRAQPEPGYQRPPPRRSVTRHRSRRPPPRRTARGAAGMPPPGETRFVPDEVLVQFSRRTSARTIARYAARHRLNVVEQQLFRLTGARVVRLRIPDRRSVRSVIASLGGSAQPNYLFSLQGETTGAREGDPARQYAIASLHLGKAHTLARGDRVLVGVIDSGIDATHPELAGAIAKSFDAFPHEPPQNHGTAVAGTIVEHAQLIGAAPAAHILAARAFGSKPEDARATTLNVLKSIDWAANNGARVINMSFAGPRDPMMEHELAGAEHKRIVLVAAAGNAGPKSPPLYPAAYAEVIAVAATDSHDHLFSKSNRGRYIAISAPGVDILAPAPHGAYQVITGTSLSAAYISGMAALLIERDPELSPHQVGRILERTAHDLGPRGHDREFGAGLADAYEALEAVHPHTAETGRR